MRFYVTDGVYFTTKEAAEKAAREVAANSFSPVDVELVEVATTRDNILRMLNVEGGHTETKATVYSAKGKRKNDD